MTNSKRQNFLLHIHPKLINEKTLRFSLTFGLGGISALLFLILIVTGLLLKFIYVPVPEKAYQSILQIQQNIITGTFIRNIHYWSASLILVVTFLHLLRVFFTGAYREKRTTNWILGLVLMIFIAGSAFTGYLLPWDQLSYWAVTVVANMMEYVPLVGKGLSHILLQGKSVDANTLLFFYNLHTGIFPLILTIILLFHFWNVRKSGGVIAPSNSENNKVPVMPNLIQRELTVGLVVLAVIFSLSLLFDAPLGEMANPLNTPSEIAAPWYFQGFQELLIHFHPLIAILILPITILIFLFYLPFFRTEEMVAGQWFISKRGPRSVLASVGGSIIFNLAFLFISNSYPNQLLNTLIFVSSIILLTILAWWLRKVKQYSIPELLQIFITISVTSFMMFTLAGIIR